MRRVPSASRQVATGVRPVSIPESRSPEERRPSVQARPRHPTARPAPAHDTPTLVETPITTPGAPDLLQPRIVSRLRATPILNSLGGGLTYLAKIPVAEETDQSDDHERRDKELAPGNYERRREHQ